MKFSNHARKAKSAGRCGEYEQETAGKGELSAQLRATTCFFLHAFSLGCGKHRGARRRGDLFFAAGVLSMSLAAGLAWGIRYLVRADDVTHASVFQCGFRFNSYIGFALAARIGGDEALALLALLIAVWGPISNALARAVAKAEGAPESGNHDGEMNGKEGNRPRTALTGRALLCKTLKGVVTNPLILATVGGLFWKGFELPGNARTNAQTPRGRVACDRTSLHRGGPHRRSASEVRSVDCRRHLRAARSYPRRGVARHERRRLLLSAPSHGSSRRASLCGYVMASAMGGNAPAVAGVTTAHILASAVTLPLWTIVIQRVLVGTAL